MIPFVLKERNARAGIVKLMLNRPDTMNCLTSSMIQALHDELSDVSQDPSAKVVILGGSGRSFCTGHDVREMTNMQTFDRYLELFNQCSRLMTKIQKLPQPVIARVHGVATAAGCQLVASCDLAIASSDAKFAVSGINLGLFCSTPSVALSRNIGRKRALEMLFTGDYIDSSTAVSWGLINKAVPLLNLDHDIDELAFKISEKAQDSIATGKVLFYKQSELNCEQAYDLASLFMAKNMLNKSAQSGFKAFVQRKDALQKSK
jgi:enoyl-CoA hydratase/carnithine racemase